LDLVLVLLKLLNKVNNGSQILHQKQQKTMYNTRSVSEIKGETDK